MNWKEMLRKKWDLWNYSKEFESYTSCDNEIEVFISELLEKQREEMIQTESDILYNRIKNSIGFDRSRKHIAWLKNKYPYLEPHHLFGSYGNKKTSDYGVLQVTRAGHIEAEKNKSDFAIDNIHLLILILIERIKELEGK